MSGASSFARSKQTSASKVKSKTKSKLNPGDSNSFPSPQSGAEDSDGGYLSSSSVSKKRRFFRLKRSDTDDTSRSSKESIPPVPALPKLALSSPSGEPIQPRSFTPLPIADRFASRSNTPLPRSETPSSSLSWDISGSYAGSSRATTPISPATRASEFSENDRLQDRDRLALPLPSPNPSMTSLESLRLTHAFKDAESVRTPSIDVLRAFGRQAGLNMRDEDVKTYLASRGVDRMKDENSSLASTSYGSLRDAAQAGALRNGVGGTYTARERSDSGATEHEATRPDTSTLDLPSPGLKIKRTLSKKRTPTPLISVGSAATSSKRMDVRSYEALKGHAGNEQRAFNIGGDDASIASTVRHDEDGYEADLTVDVTPATPSSGRSRLTESSGV
ncbi:uncharacterized protein PHACADRAFT_263380 [Phanerochaete carnosa HHB-10118-sp]|uniref:Uncharacterized protein n=1 Tax=Phanerochaete carnosa (strain HHB-10118-sp) TaxID=650164 RepID=K5UNM3_PHACS|nr:uncharacterized protein PHACADRAFT_263380 [Phanerochaete carnosa HHB-10118-sp]EKM51336.1 hypothetical protein PHACADRAFT_263380 [Phanerochaete carnosa HHB-10118-sp]